MSDDDDVMTQAEAARRLGLSRSRITQCKNMGMPVLHDGMVSLSAVRRWMYAHLDPARHPKVLREPAAPPAPAVKAASPAEPQMNPEAIEVLKSHLAWALHDVHEDVAILSVAAKLRMEQVFALSGAITYHVWTKIEDRLRAAGVLGADEELQMVMNPPAFWEHLAGRAGERYDLPAWKAFSTRQFGDGEPDA